MGAQAMWLYWLLSEVNQLESDFERYMPIMEQEKDRIKNLTATNNDINTKIGKLNETYFDLKVTVDGFQATRDMALPKIASLGKNIEKNSMKVKKYNDFY